MRNPSTPIVTDLLERFISTLPSLHEGDNITSLRKKIATDKRFDSTTRFQLANALLSTFLPAPSAPAQDNVPHMGGASALAAAPSPSQKSDSLADEGYDCLDELYSRTQAPKAYPALAMGEARAAVPASSASNAIVSDDVSRLKTYANITSALLNLLAGCTLFAWENKTTPRAIQLGSIAISYLTFGLPTTLALATICYSSFYVSRHGKDQTIKNLKEFCHSISQTMSKDNLRSVYNHANENVRSFCSEVDKNLRGEVEVARG